MAYLLSAGGELTHFRLQRKAAPRWAPPLCAVSARLAPSTTGSG